MNQHLWWSAWTWIMVIFQLTAWQHGVTGLKNVMLKIPDAGAVLRGATVALTCTYDLEDTALYAVKWYQDEKEFYRYVPKEMPPTKVFALPGVKVDVAHSNERAVVLTDVHLEMSGYYRCEVSADAPSFHTDIASAQMIVVAPPNKPPVIDVEKTEYEVGERLRANCTSVKSYPGANLTWYINDVPVGKNHIREYAASVASDYMETTRIGLEFDTETSSFPGGKMSLKCSASIFSIHRKITETEINEEKPRLASVLGTRESPNGRGGTSGMGRETPVPLISMGVAVLLLIGR